MRYDSVTGQILKYRAVDMKSAEVWMVKSIDIVCTARQEGLTSRYIPNTITPSLGASMISSGGIVKMENSKERLSIASICSRAYVCKDAVIKPLKTTVKRNVRTIVRSTTSSKSLLCKRENDTVRHENEK